jgi:hypothetical protein
MGTADKEERTSLIQCSLNLLLVDGKGNQVSAGEGEATVDREYLTVAPKFGDVIPVHLRDVVEVDSDSYRLTLSLASGERLFLFDLGHYFEDFVRVLMDQRNEVTIRDMLMNEATRNPDVEAEFAYQAEGTPEVEGSGKLRLYETSLVVMPERGDVFRIPLSDIVSVLVEDYNATISTELGEKLVLRRMGSEFDPFLRVLSEASNDLQKSSVSILKDLLPGVDSQSLRKIAGLMKEGRAAKKADIDNVDPKAFKSLERRLKSVGLGESYVYLKTLGRQDRICIGLKRGLMGDLTGEYVWFLIPIYGDAGFGGNAIAMESIAVGEDNSGGATYFFRIVSRKAYLELNVEQLDKANDRLVRTLNRCMIDINFRREPIYLPEERLEEPKYMRYKIALKKLPPLRLARSLFIGRVVHSSPDQWRRDVHEILRFNASERDDSLKWRQ